MHNKYDFRLIKAFDHNSDATGQRTHLLGLPPELRDMILEQLGPWGIESAVDIKHPGDDRRAKGIIVLPSLERTACTNLLVVCRTIGREMKYILDKQKDKVVLMMDPSKETKHFGFLPQYPPQGGSWIEKGFLGHIRHIDVINVFCAGIDLGVIRRKTEEQQSGLVEETLQLAQAEHHGQAAPSMKRLPSKSPHDPFPNVFPSLQRLTLSFDVGSQGAGLKVASREVQWHEYLGEDCVQMPARDRAVFQGAVESFVSFRIRDALAKQHLKPLDVDLLCDLEHAVHFMVEGIDTRGKYKFSEGATIVDGEKAYHRIWSVREVDKEVEWKKSSELKSALTDDLIYASMAQSRWVVKGVFP